MKNNSNSKKPSGHSRAAQNKKIRRDALREELQSREYIRQLGSIEERLDPDADDHYEREDIPMVRERANILFRLLDKCLPNLRPADIPVQVPAGDSLTDRGTAILTAMANGDITPNEATSLMKAMSAQAKLIEVDQLAERLSVLEERYNT